MNNIKTVLHTYSFNILKDEEAALYQELRAKLKAQGLTCFETWGGHSHYCPQLAGPIELETDHIFNNQWNSTTHSVFDWAQDYMPNQNKYLKRGHYLEQTQEMVSIRDKTCACGYCGKQYPSTYMQETAFCKACIDSEYLKEAELHLLRLKIVSDAADRQPLTDDEAKILKPYYLQAQLHGTTERGKARIAKQRADIVVKRDKALQKANTEHDGMLWLMDHGVNTQNVIYYAHTNTFSFGWRQKLSPETAAELEKLLVGFPFPYKIETA